MNKLPEGLPEIFPREEAKPKMEELAARYHFKTYKALRMAEGMYEQWMENNKDEKDHDVVCQTLVRDRATGWPIVSASAAFIVWSIRVQQRLEDDAVVAPRTLGNMLRLVVELFGHARNARLRLPDLHEYSAMILEGFFQWAVDLMNTCNDERCEGTYSLCERSGMSDFLRKLLGG